MGRPEGRSARARVDPIQRRIVLAITNIPEGQERPETPSKVIPMESDDYNMSDPIRFL